MILSCFKDMKIILGRERKKILLVNIQVHYSVTVIVNSGKIKKIKITDIF